MDKFWKNLTEYLKERWWLSIVLIVVIILYLIPAYYGLPGDNYRGCDGDSRCQNALIKSVTKNDDGSETITLSLRITDTKNQNAYFKMPKGGDYLVGENVLYVYSPSIHLETLFVARKTNMLFDLTIGGLVTPGADASFDSNTGKPVKVGP